MGRQSVAMLALVLGAVLLALCPGCLAQSWAQGPLAIYNDGDPAAAGNMDLARKKAFVNSLTTTANARDIERILSTARPSVPMAAARSHALMANTLQTMSPSNLATLRGLVDRTGGLLVLAATWDSSADYNMLLGGFLGMSPGCTWVQSTANNLEQYNGPGFPSVLLTGSNKYIAFTCTTGIPWYTEIGRSGVVYVFQTPNGGFIKLLGYDFSATSRNRDWRDVALYVPSAAQMIPQPVPPPAPPPPPNPVTVTSSVILLGEGAVKLPDEDRKTQLQAALILLLGMNNVLPKTAPGQAPLHVAFVNTYLALGPNQKQNLRNQIQNGRTTISVVISPETPATDIAALLEDIAPGAGIACSPFTLAPGASLTAMQTSQYAGKALGVPNFARKMTAVAQTVALACNTGRSVVAVDGADNAGRAALVEIPVGSGFLRLVGYDFTSGGYADPDEVTTAQRWPVTATVACALPGNMAPLGAKVPPSPPRAAKSPSPPPRPPFPPPDAFGGKLPTYLLLTDTPPLADQAAKDMFRDGIAAISSAPNLYPTPYPGALVHLGFDTTYVRLSADNINVLKGEINKRATIATIVATAAVLDAQLNTLLLNLTSLPGIRCVSAPVEAGQRIARQMTVNGDVRSDGWRAQANTRAHRCNAGQVVYSLSTSTEFGVIREFTTPAGGTVRLVGYDFTSGGKGSDRKPLSALSIFIAPVVAPKQETLPLKPLDARPPPPPPRMSPPPAMKEPPRPPPYVRSPRPPAGAVPPRPVRPPPPPVGEEFDVIILVDTSKPNNTDATRKDNLAAGLKDLVRRVGSATRPGNAPVHVVFDNTYMHMDPLIKEDILTRVLNYETTLVILATTQTTATNLTNYARTATGLSDIQCFKEKINPGTTLVPSLGIQRDIVGSGWRSLGGTSSVFCYQSMAVYESLALSKPIAIEFWLPGGGTVRIIGYDMSFGARGTNGRTAVTRFVATPDHCGPLPRPSPPPNPPPQPPSPRPPSGGGGEDARPPPPAPPLTEGVILAAIITDNTNPTAGADAERKRSMRQAVDAYVGGSELVGKVTAGNFVGSELAGAPTLIAFDNTLMNANQWNGDAMTTLATSVDIGQTLLSLVLVPPVFYTNNQFSALLRALSGYADVACTKTVFATAATTEVFTLNAVNHDPLAQPMPPTLSHSGAAASLTCTGFPDGTFNPIYTYQDRTVVAEVITPNFGVIRVVAFDFYRTTMPQSWAQLLSYSFRISTGAPRER